MQRQSQKWGCANTRHGKPGLPAAVIDKAGFPSGFQRDTILCMPSFQTHSFQEYTSAPVSGIVCDALFGSPGKQKQVGICSHLFCDPSVSTKSLKLSVN